MKNWLNWMARLLAVAMIFSLVACNGGSATEEEKSREGLVFWSNRDGTCSVLGFTERIDADLVIPKTSPEIGRAHV